MPFFPSSANKSPLEITERRGSSLTFFILKSLYNCDNDNNIEHAFTAFSKISSTFTRFAIIIVPQFNSEETVQSPKHRVVA